MPVPLYGFLEGDTIGLLIMADENETIQDITNKLQQAASIRVKPTATAQLVLNGKVISPVLTIAQSGLAALDRFDLCQEKQNNLEGIIDVF